VKAPAFWWQDRPTLPARLLGPAAAIYAGVADRRLRQPGTRASVPVLCVGNVTVGGAGKTPTAIALAALLRDLGRKPAFLLRGYGGRLPGPVLVDEHHDEVEVGDEALLLAAHGATVVSRDRPAGAALAVHDGADVIVMDDGLQNPPLAKDLALAVFDGAAGIGNGRVLPAGPLRASLDRQWPLIDAALVIGPGAAGDAVAVEASRRGKPVLRARIVPDEEAAAALAGRRVLAFAGIGRPAKFFDTLAELGADVARTRTFPDHHRYGAGEVARLLDEAERENLVPVTTAKDAVRLRSLREDEPRVAAIRTLPVRIAFAEPERVAALLRERLLR
jgi:tetraacyldisaccharide 4'-kinase